MPCAFFWRPLLDATLPKRQKRSESVLRAERRWEEDGLAPQTIRLAGIFRFRSKPSFQPVAASLDPPPRDLARALDAGPP
jgi:hypothetical protein